MSVLEGKKSVDILQAVNKEYFDDDHTFGAEQGLNIAISVVNVFDRDTFEPIDPRYGKLRF